MRLLSAMLVAALGLALTPSRATAFDGRSVFNLQSTWRDQDGHALKLEALAGAPTVVALFYAGCKTVCPMTVAELQLLQAALPEASRKRVRFVLVSLDPAHDQPERLRQFARERHLDPGHWTLLNGAADDVGDLAAALDVHYKDRGSGEIAHDAAIFLVDAAGVVKQRVTDARGSKAELAAVLSGL